MAEGAAGTTKGGTNLRGRVSLTVGQEEANGVVVHRCSGQEAVEAINRGTAKAEDFLLVRGFCLWPKGVFAQQASNEQAWKAGAISEGGLQALVDLGHFEQLSALSPSLWKELLQLGMPSESPEIDLGFAQWEKAGAHVLPLGIGSNGSNGSGPKLDEGMEVNVEARIALADEALREFVNFFFTSVDN